MATLLVITHHHKFFKILQILFSWRASKHLEAESQARQSEGSNASTHADIDIHSIEVLRMLWKIT